MIGRGVVATIGTQHFATATKDRTIHIDRPVDSIRYSFAAAPGYRNLAVRGGLTDGSGIAIAKAGVLRIGKGASYLLATSDVILHVRPEDARLLDLTKQMLSASDPRADYTLVACEQRRMERVYGDSAAREIAGEVTYILESEWPPYWERYWKAAPIVDELRARPSPECGSMR